MFVIVESSALYAFGVIGVLASFLSDSNGQYPAVDAIVPLVVRRCLSSTLVHSYSILPFLRESSSL